MENLKSLQEGGPEVIDETKQIAEALTKMVNEQEVPLEQALMQMFQSGLQQDQAVEVLMTMGYTEEDIQSLFQSMQEKAQPQEEEQGPVVMPEQEVEEPVEQPQQQEQPMAKKGKEKYNKGGDFRNWMNRNFGYINDNDKYDVPARFRYLPTGINRNSGLDFITDMFNVGKRVAGVVKDAKARKNDPSYNKSLIKFGKDANPEDFYITDESIYQASQNNGDLITKDQAVQMMKDKSRFMYNPDTKAFSFALERKPFASESEIQEQINREMGKNYRDKYKQMSLSDYEKTMNLFKSFIPSFAPRNKTTTATTSNSNTSNSTDPIKGETQDSYNKRVNGMETYSYNTYIWDGSKWVPRKQLGGGTHNTYYGQVGVEYPGTINQTEFPGFTFGDTPDYTASEDNRPLSFRNWFAQNYGSNLNFANQSQNDLTQQYSSYLQDFDPYTYVSEGVKEKPKDKPGSILDPLRDIETNYTDEEVDAYMNLSEDLAASNFVNKGSMGKQPSVEAQQQLQDAMPKDTSAKVKIKNKGTFSKALDTAADVAGVAVDAGRSINKLLQDAENLKKYNEIVYGTADEQFGTDIGSKGYWTALDGILSPNRQTTFIGQNGKEMKNYNDYFMMQYGGGNFPQVQQDNTRVNQMSEADMQAYVNMMNAAQNEEVFFEHFPHLRNMKKMPVRDPALQDRDTNVVIKDGMAYYPKYATGYIEGEEGSGDNRGLVKDYLDPKWKGKRSMIPYFEVGSDPNSVSLMRKFQNSNLPFDFGNAFPRGYVDVEEYLQNISPVGRKMQMGGMNPMSDFFMDNDLPLYQVGGGDIDLSAYPMDEKGLYILNAIPDLPTMRAAAKYNQKVKGIVPSSFGKPRVEVYKTQYQQTPPALRTPTIPLTPEEQRAREEYIIKVKEQHKRVKDKRDQGPAYQQRYGGDPFMPKRKLRKKKGGQIANIPTDTLKKLMAKVAKFDVL